MAHTELQLDNQICFRLYTAARLVTQAYTPMLTALGITYPQYLVLMVLWEKDEQPVNDIAHRLYLETNTVTPLLQRMEKLGIVSRKKGEQDKRGNCRDCHSNARYHKRAGHKEQDREECNAQQRARRLRNAGQIELSHLLQAALIGVSQCVHRPESKCPPRNEAHGRIITAYRTPKPSHQEHNRAGDEALYLIRGERFGLLDV